MNEQWIDVNDESDDEPFLCIYVWVRVKDADGNIGSELLLMPQDDLDQYIYLTVENRDE